METTPSKTESGSDHLGKLDAWWSLAERGWGIVQTYLVPIGLGGLMMVSASITDWLHDAGPVVWGAIGVATFFVTLLIHGWWVSRRATSRLTNVHASIAEKIEGRSPINPMAERFFKQRVRLHDLRNPVGAPIENRTFEKCELMGPATIVLAAGSEIAHCEFNNVEFAKIPLATLRPKPNKMFFHKCTIRHSKIYNVLVLVPDERANDYESGFVGGVPWIN